MNYIEAIKTAIFIFPIIAFLFTIPFILYNYHKYGSIHWFKTLIIYTFILYLITIFFLVILPLPKVEEVLKNTGPYINLKPFKFVSDFLKETSFVLTDSKTYLNAIKEPCFYVVIFNIFMTIPFGMYLHYYFQCNFKKITIYTFLLSLFFELTQVTGLYFIYPNPYRLCDIDDLILNTLGGVIGFLIMKFFKRFLPTREKLDEEALEEGKKVSGLRRITVFFLDIIIVFILLGIIKIWFPSTKYITFILIFIYYIGIPIIIKNQTLAMKFLNVKMHYEKQEVRKNIERCLFLSIYYFVIPILIIYILSFIIKTYQLYSLSVIIHLSEIIGIFFFYLINILIILIRKKIFYDYLFHFLFGNFFFF